MRIAITSDIHYFPRWRAEILALASRLRALEPDLLIMAGDLGEPLHHFTGALAVFENVCEQRAALAGNHDVWHRTGDHSSQQLWEVLLPGAAAIHGYTWLDHENLVVDDLGICGSIAWYDYGARHDSLDFEIEFYQHIKQRVSNDANYIDWEWSDREFARRVSRAFLQRLDALETDPGVRDILVATHVPLFRQCVRPVENLLHAIANAYYANTALGEEVLKRHKVRAVVSGHVHREHQLAVRRSNTVAGQANDSLPDVFACTNPADYGKPAAVLLDTDSWQVEIISAAERERSFHSHNTSS